MMSTYAAAIHGIFWVLRAGAPRRDLPHGSLENKNLSIRSAADELFPARAAGRWLPS
jgi:transposase